MFLLLSFFIYSTLWHATPWFGFCLWLALLGRRWLFLCSLLHHILYQTFHPHLMGFSSQSYISSSHYSLSSFNFFLNLFLKFLLYFICVLSACVFVYHTARLPGAHGGQRVSCLMELEMAVGSGMEPRSSARAACMLNGWAISPASLFYSLIIAFHSFNNFQNLWNWQCPNVPLKDNFSTLSFFFFFKKSHAWAGELVQWLRALVALLHGGSLSSVTPVLGDSVTSSGLQRHQAHTTCIQACKALMHIK